MSQHVERTEARRPAGMQGGSFNIIWLFNPRSYANNGVLMYHEYDGALRSATDESVSSVLMRGFAGVHSARGR